MFKGEKIGAVPTFLNSLSSNDLFYVMLVFTVCTYTCTDVAVINVLVICSFGALAFK